MRIILFFLVVMLLGFSQLYGQGDSLIEKDPHSDSLIVLEKEPIPINMNEIKKKIGYPMKAQKDSIQGKVLFRVLIDKEGNCVSYKLLKSVSSIFTEAIEPYIKELKFTPGFRKGKPIKCWVTVPFIFKLTR